MSDQDLRVGQRMMASGTGGTVSVLCMTPLEVIKTRLQAQGKDSYAKERFKGTLDALVKIPRREGVTALWSGLSPTLAMVIPSTVLYFTSYDVIKIHLQTRRDFSPHYAVVTSGAIARTVTVFAIAPLELIRTKMQSEKITFSELRKVLRSVTKSHGVRSLYMGLGSTLYRDVFFSCIYWSSYEFLKRMFFPDERPPLQFTMIAGAAAGSTAAVITLPFDVIKTHRLAMVFILIIREEIVKMIKDFPMKNDHYVQWKLEGLDCVIGKWISETRMSYIKSLRRRCS